MTSYGLIGAETPVDDLLEQYFPGRPKNSLYQAFESEQAALMAAMLMEMRGDDVDQDVGGQEEAVYHSKPGIPVDSVQEDKHEWDFSADTVVVYGFDSPVAVAYKAPNKDNRLIPLTTTQEPFTLSPPGGLGASTLWYRKMNEDDSDTSLNIIALK